MRQHSQIDIIPPTRPLLLAPQSSGMTYAIGMLLVALILSTIFVFLDVVRLRKHAAQKEPTTTEQSGTEPLR